MHVLSRVGLVFLGLSASLPSRSAGQAGAPFTWDSAGRILGAVATPAAGFTRFAFPRGDLIVRVGDVVIAKGLALTGWVGFAGEPANALLLGDLVVTGEELRGVAEALRGGGLQVSAVHNHLAGEAPQIFYVHVQGSGPADSLARVVAKALDRTAAPRPVQVSSAAPATADTAAIFLAMGLRGRASGPLVSLSTQLIPDEVRVLGRVIPPALGTPSPINLQQLSGGEVAATGDFAVLANRVEPLTRALSAAGITVTAIHSHLVGESPAVTYIHFWARGAQRDVLRGLRSALDAGR